MMLLMTRYIDMLASTLRFQGLPGISGTCAYLKVSNDSGRSATVGLGLGMGPGAAYHPRLRRPRIYVAPTHRCTRL